jgi:hypothetical protein
MRSAVEGEKGANNAAERVVRLAAEQDAGLATPRAWPKPHMVRWSTQLPWASSLFVPSGRVESSLRADTLEERAHNRPSCTR